MEQYFITLNDRLRSLACDIPGFLDSRVFIGSHWDNGRLAYMVTLTVSVNMETINTVTPSFNFLNNAVEAAFLEMYYSLAILRGKAVQQTLTAAA